MIKDGFQIIPSRIDQRSISALRLEADRLAKESGTSCVRNIRAKSPLFHQLAEQPELLSLLPPGMRPVRSILFDKTPTQNWPVAWHQDLTIAVNTEKQTPNHGPWSIKDGVPHVQPPLALLEQMLTLRLHLDDTPPENDALKVIPASHLLGRISSEQVGNIPKNTSVTCPCNIGDILLMSPLLLHSSQRSQSPSRRRVIHFEYAPLKALHPNLSWHEKIHA